MRSSPQSLDVAYPQSFLPRLPCHRVKWFLPGSNTDPLKLTEQTPHSCGPPFPKGTGSYTQLLTLRCNPGFWPDCLFVVQPALPVDHLECRTPASCTGIQLPSPQLCLNKAARDVGGRSCHFIHWSVAVPVGEAQGQKAKKKKVFLEVLA